MPIIQLTGLSGAGKTTLAYAVVPLLEANGQTVTVVDGDEYRKTICSDLGFSREDRMENIRRLGAVANKLATPESTAIIAAINPFEAVREELRDHYGATVVWVQCELQTLFERDTKGLYKRTSLPHGHPDRIQNLTGVNDPFEIPPSPDLIIDTSTDDIESSVKKLFNYIMMLHVKLGA